MRDYPSVDDSPVTDLPNSLTGGIDPSVGVMSHTAHTTSNNQSTLEVKGKKKKTTAGGGGKGKANSSEEKKEEGERYVL